jgi:hypothetical protein
MTRMGTEMWIEATYDETSGELTNPEFVNAPDDQFLVD